MANLLRYSERAKFATQIGLVGVAHFASAYNVIGDDGSFAPLAELVGDELVDDLLADSYIDACVRADAKGRSVLGSYLRERAARETPVGRDFLRGLAESEAGAFEVLAAEQQAVRLRDALEEREPFVAEINPECELMDAGAVIGARVSRFRGSLCLVGGIWPLTEESVAELAASKAGEGVEELADEPGFEDIAAEGPLEAAGGLAPVISSLVLLQVLGDAAWADEDDTTS